MRASGARFSSANCATNGENENKRKDSLVSEGNESKKNKEQKQLCLYLSGISDEVDGWFSMSGEEAITRFFKTAGEGQRCRPACSSLTAEPS